MSSLIDIVELLMTAEIYNTQDSLVSNDLPAGIRRAFWNPKVRDVPKPVRITDKKLKEIFGIDDPEKAVRVNGIKFGYIIIDANLGTVRLTGGGLDSCAEWFEKQEGAADRIAANPVLSYYYGTVLRRTGSGYDCEKAKAANPPKESTKEWVASIVRELEDEKGGGKEWLKLAYIKAPEEVRESEDDLILTEHQKNELKKIRLAIQNKEHLKEIGLYDIGKILFVGPPGTGKTSVARALSRSLSVPIIEVRLSMITDQYLGETSKNIDRVFALAKRFNPCIMFIDEIDFMAMSRSNSEDHAAIRQAVNTLLKAIDDTNLVEHGVLLIGATNHTKHLDEAVWRRFDEIVDFPVPDERMRKDILDIVTKKISGNYDTGEIAQKTEGYTGSDLRIIVREAVLSALLENRYELTQDDLLKAVGSFSKRAGIKSADYLSRY